jgi:site-specific DNA-methyltransferase (adenine-specific)
MSTPSADAPWLKREGFGDATLYLGDCRMIAPLLSRPAALIGDPPYGIAFAHSGGGRSKYQTKFLTQIVGDDRPFDPSPWLKFAPIVVLWGANHFADRLPSAPGWLVWDKRAASHHSNSFADCELAWTNVEQPARMFRHHWDGMMRASEKDQARVHPMQKPIALMTWCMERVGVPKGGRVLDPFMGSGTTGVACLRSGRRFVGIEIDPQYFEIACRRIEEAAREPKQDTLFVETTPQAEQGALFEEG